MWCPHAQNFECGQALIAHFVSGCKIIVPATCKHILSYNNSYGCAYVVHDSCMLPMWQFSLHISHFSLTYVAAVRMTVYKLCSVPSSQNTQVANVLVSQVGILQLLHKEPCFVLLLYKSLIDNVSYPCHVPYTMYNYVVYVVLCNYVDCCIKYINIPDLANLFHIVQVHKS